MYLNSIVQSVCKSSSYALELVGMKVTVNLDNCSFLYCFVHSSNVFVIVKPITDLCTNNENVLKHKILY